MQDFCVGLIIGALTLGAVLANIDVDAERVTKNLEKGHLMCASFGGLKSYDFSEYTCADGAIVK